MRDRLLSYIDMCLREGASLQRGMNFRLHGKHSVILMSVRKDAPYNDRIEDDGTILIYEGHDVPNRQGQPDPKTIDQQEKLPSGRLTENGKFHAAAQDYIAGRKGPDIVRVYEKIKKGIWSDNGSFLLVGSWVESDSVRKVFKFKLEALSDREDSENAVAEQRREYVHGRVIPTQVKIEVFSRDGGKCRVCGASDELHFDHILPFSKGGTSLMADNIQILCARHNLEKGAKIE